MATLQKAIVLDSLGYSDDAKKLYKQLRGHAVACGWSDGGYVGFRDGKGTVS